MKTAVMTDVMKMEFVERDIPKPARDEVLVKVEYVGKEPNIKDEDKVYPNITARYDNNTETIIANASVSKGNITKIELIYKDQVINTAENPNRRSKV